MWRRAACHAVILASLSTQVAAFLPLTASPILGGRQDVMLNGMLLQSTMKIPKTKSCSGLGGRGLRTARAMCQEQKTETPPTSDHIEGVKPPAVSERTTHDGNAGVATFLAACGLLGAVVAASTLEQFPAQLPLILTFVAGYSAIVFEDAVKINKSASALMMGILCWMMVSAPLTCSPHSNGVYAGLLS